MKTKRELEAEIKDQKLMISKLSLALQDLSVRCAGYIDENKTIKAELSHIKNTLKRLSDPCISEAKCYKIIFELLQNE